MAASPPTPETTPRDLMAVVSTLLDRSRFPDLPDAAREALEKVRADLRTLPGPCQSQAWWTTRSILLTHLGPPGGGATDRAAWGAFTGRGEVEP